MEMMTILAHADHPEIFFLGMLAGLVLVAIEWAWRRKARK